MIMRRTRGIGSTACAAALLAHSPNSRALREYQVRRQTTVYSSNSASPVYLCLTGYTAAATRVARARVRREMPKMRAEYSRSGGL